MVHGGGGARTQPACHMPFTVRGAGEADIDNLIPLYNKVYAALRTVDNDTIVFYEPSVHEARRVRARCCGAELARIT